MTKWEENVIDRMKQNGIRNYIIGDYKGFSWHGCDVCGDGLGGDKHAVTAQYANNSEGNPVFEAFGLACVDCTFWIANGDVPEGVE